MLHPPQHPLLTLNPIHHLISLLIARKPLVFLISEWVVEMGARLAVEV
jgi:hypothetical protein